MESATLPRIADHLPTLEEWQRFLKHLERQEEQAERLRQENETLRRQLEDALRAGKRQAAPFSRQTPKGNPQKPGRKAGRCYGRAHWRPPARQVDEELSAPLPKQCPHCGGATHQEKIVEQYQTEIPKVEPIQRRFDIEVGHCWDCGRRVQGRHLQQTSAAVGVAGATLGPQLLALVVVLNKRYGLSHEKIAELLRSWGVKVSRSGLCQAIQRAAAKAEPTYQGLVKAVRASPQVTPDETGWRVGGQSRWLWAFATPQTTVYAILPGRGFAEACQVLGPDYAGVLVHDGWCIYEQFLRATHQTCLAHLLRRCREMAESASAWNARFPLAVKELLQHALELRDRWRQHTITAQGLAVARGILRKQFETVWSTNFRCAANERLANHLWNQQEHGMLLTFLRHLSIDATNWRAEQALRPFVIVRKVWGGNRTEHGAHAQQILGSVLQTCRQQNRSPIPVLQRLLCARRPPALSLLPRQSAVKG
jgi:transposase